jgi:hypothetical protein
MKQQCISEGDLRAWLDRELEPAELEVVETHLNECEACLALSEQLSARANLVMSALNELPVTRQRPERSTWRWALPVAALAACLLIALTLGPKAMRPKSNVVRVATPDSHPPQDEPQRVALQPPPGAPMVPHRGKRRAVVPQETRLTARPFVALDDEPIETGVVMRVGTEAGGFQADVLVGPDGRAHAIRILME